MSADSAPDHVSFAVDNFLAVLEGGPPILSVPGQLEDVAPLLHRLDSKAAAKSSSCLEVFDEFLDRPFECGTLIGTQPTPVAIELFRL